MRNFAFILPCLLHHFILQPSPLQQPEKNSPLILLLLFLPLLFLPLLFLLLFLFHYFLVIQLVLHNELLPALHCELALNYEPKLAFLFIIFSHFLRLHFLQLIWKLIQELILRFYPHLMTE